MKRSCEINVKSIAIIAVVGISGALMLSLRFGHVMVFSFPVPERFGHEINYQLITFLLFLLVLGISILLGGKKAVGYLYPGRFNGPVTPVPLLGINTKGNEDWLKVGVNFLIIITAVNAAVVYFQVFRGNETNFSITGILLPAFAFAIVNSLIEEGIFRYSIVSVFLSTGISSQKAAITSGILFGAVHYFGTPGGIPGIILAGFLAWFLAKSIAETRSIGWAWLIHAAQDLVIFSSVFAV